MSGVYKGRNGRADRIDRFFAGPGARGDQWRTLVELAEAWSNGSGNRPEFEAVLSTAPSSRGFWPIATTSQVNKTYRSSAPASKRRMNVCEENEGSSIARVWATS